MNGRLLRLLTAGESHGPALTAILDGLPAGIPIDIQRDIVPMLARRQKRLGASARQRIETDVPALSAGIIDGRTTGAPISFRLENKDHARWQQPVNAMTVPRPGHADLVGAVKYAFDDLRPSLERASARETAIRVCAGAVCRAFLQTFDIHVGSFVSQLGPVRAALPDVVDVDAWRRYFYISKNKETSMPTPEADSDARNVIVAAQKAGDTFGGEITAFCTGLPPGLGSFMQPDRKLDARLGGALFALPAVKGVAFGSGFELGAARGTQVKDTIVKRDDGALVREHNHGGGLEGGVSTGGPLYCRVAFKPISTTKSAGMSVDLSTGEAREIAWERSDVCAVPRACPIVESALALVLADALLEKTGGDSLDEIAARVATLRRAHVDDLRLSGAPLNMYTQAVSNEQ